MTVTDPCPQRVFFGFHASSPASPSAGAPSLPATPAWEWAAAAFAGTQAVTIDGVLHAITGSPQVWMP